MGFLIIAPFAILAGWSIFAIHRWLQRSSPGGEWRRQFTILSCVGAAVGVFFAFFLQYNVANKHIEGFPIPLQISNRDNPADPSAKASIPVSIRIGAMVTDLLCGVALCLVPLAVKAFFKENRAQGNPRLNPPSLTPKRFMVIAGEASGDMLAAELVGELRAAIARTPTYSANAQPLRADLAPVFFGAGGPRMAEAGVELAFDLTQHSLIGLPGLRGFLKFRARLNQLIALACEREPHAIICVDFQLFNSTFAAAIKRRILARRGPFNNWQPKIIKYISPQVWASREKRAYTVARDFDLVLSIFPFEKEWYAARVPNLRVEFVGHPMVERYDRATHSARSVELPSSPTILLLPGSRKGELQRHWPVMLAAWEKIKAAFPSARAKAVLPDESLAALAQSSSSQSVTVQVGGLAEAMAEADLAISKTGTITMECAFFGVPTVTMYVASAFTYQVGKRIVKVKSLTMPNLLAKEEVFPEFIQAAATPDNISRAALQLLQNQPHREKVRAKLAEIIASLGGPGASRRAADAILAVMR